MTAGSRTCDVSVVIATHNRVTECKRAVFSALEQQPAPREVIVCDDGSADDTPAQLEDMSRRDARVRYIRLHPSHGTPGPARNAGIRAASGTWIAFLDDDDRWRAGKLAAQLPFIERDEHDVIAGDAVRTSGPRYFGGEGLARPNREQIERANPVILSSSVVRATALRDAAGFDEDPRLRGVEDYGLWLRLAAQGAHFVVLHEPLVDYTDHGDDRLSDARLATQRRLLLLRARRWREAPFDRLTLLSLVREAYLTLSLAAHGRLPDAKQP